MSALGRRVRFLGNRQRQDNQCSSQAPEHSLKSKKGFKSGGFPLAILTLAGLFGYQQQGYAAGLDPLPQLITFPTGFGGVAPVLTPPTASNWNGFYFGVDMGVGSAFTHYDYANNFVGILDSHTKIGEINGASPGGYTGFNYQVGPLVFGAEADATFTNGMFRLNGPNVDFLQTSNLISTVSGRLGLLVTPDTMVYGRLGASRIQLAGVDSFGTYFHHTLPGQQTGIGIEHLLADAVALRVEATYTSSDRALSLNNGFDQYRPSFLQVTAGLSYKIDPLPNVVKAPPIDLKNPFLTHDPSWTSIYFGGLLGMGIGQVTRDDRTFGLMGPYEDLRMSRGLMAGGDIQLFKYLVLGGAVERDWVKATFDDDVGTFTTPVIHRFAHVDRVSAVTARVGILVSPTTLFYVKGGPARIKFVPEQDYFAATNPAVVTSAHDMDAVQGGLGIETALADHVALRVEALYTRANQLILIDGLQPAQTSLQPSTLTAQVGLVVKY
jgi:opacity protein-like surface antigen